MKRIFFGVLCFSLCLSACKKEDEDDDDSAGCSGATMTVNMDGNSYTPTGYNNTLIKLTEDGESGRRFDLRANVNGGQIILTFSMWDSQNPPAEGVVKKTYGVSFNHPETYCYTTGGSFTHCDGALVTYYPTVGSLTGSYWSLDEDDLDSYIKITGNDPANHTVTGNFSAVITDDFAGDTINVSGSFSNVCYTYLQ